MLYLTWMMAAFPLGWFLSHVIIAVVFYLVLTPIGTVLRLLGHDLLHRSFDRSVSSYWLAREDPENPERYYRQY